MTGTKALSRRRFLSIAAATACTGLLPASAIAARPLVWRGTALGAEASLTLVHPDEAVARRILTAALTEIRRLEAVFSLYRADSAVSRIRA